MLSSRVVVASFLLTASCGGSSSPPPAAPSTTTAAPVGTTDGADAGTTASDSAVVDALTADEAKRDACDPDHAAALEKLLGQVEASIRASERGPRVETAARKTLALSDASRGFALTLTGKGTEVHVLAFAAKEVSLDVLAGSSAATTMRSPLVRQVFPDGATIALPRARGAVALETDSRQLEMSAGQPLQVKLRGHGCAGVIVLSGK